MKSEKDKIYTEYIYNQLKQYLKDNHIRFDFESCYDLLDTRKINKFMKINKYNRVWYLNLNYDTIRFAYMDLRKTKNINDKYSEDLNIIDFINPANIELFLLNDM